MLFIIIIFLSFRYDEAKIAHDGTLFSMDVLEVSKSGVMYISILQPQIAQLPYV